MHDDYVLKFAINLNSVQNYSILKLLLYMNYGPFILETCHTLSLEILFSNVFSCHLVSQNGILCIRNANSYPHYATCMQPLFLWRLF